MLNMFRERCLSSDIKHLQCFPSFFFRFFFYTRCRPPFMSSACSMNHICSVLYNSPPRTASAPLLLHVPRSQWRASLGLASSVFINSNGFQLGRVHSLSQRWSAEMRCSTTQEDLKGCVSCWSFSRVARGAAKQTFEQNMFIYGYDNVLMAMWV